MARSAGNFMPQLRAFDRSTMGASSSQQSEDLGCCIAPLSDTWTSLVSDPGHLKPVILKPVGRM